MPKMDYLVHPVQGKGWSTFGYYQEGDIAYEGKGY